MDEIIGKAVLSAVNPSDGYEYLFLICLSPSRRTIQTSAIPIREKTKPNPGNRGWVYTVRGNTLEVSPSLKISMPAIQDANPPLPERELFHNGGQWTVQFEKEVYPDGASDQLRAINQVLFDSYREQGYKHF